MEKRNEQSNKFRNKWKNDWATDWVTDWLTDWVTDWLTDWPTDRPTDRPTNRLTDWLTEVNDLKESSKRSIDQRQWIYVVNLVNADEATKRVLPTEGSCKRTIKRIQKDRVSLQPNSLDRLIPSGTLINDNRVNTASRMIIFTTDDNLRLLANFLRVIFSLAFFQFFKKKISG